MKLEADAVIPFPREAVWRVYRDDLAELTRYLPNVRRIEVKGRKEAGETVELVNEWFGGGEMPSVARAFLSESLLAWTDYATWNANDWTCRWRTETHSFKDLVRAEGLNRYVNLDGSTRLEIRGDLDIDPSRLAMVPRFLRGSAAPAIEHFLVGRVKANLLDVAEGVTKLLRERGAR